MDSDYSSERDVLEWGSLICWGNLQGQVGAVTQFRDKGRNKKMEAWGVPGRGAGTLTKGLRPQMSRRGCHLALGMLGRGRVGSRCT